MTFFKPSEIDGFGAWLFHTWHYYTKDGLVKGVRIFGFERERLTPFTPTPDAKG